MRRLLLLVPLALAGCPPPTQYLIADVTAAGAPVQDAMVTADCAQNNYSYPATRTDADGRARVQMYNREINASRCSLTVAKPGYSTVEVDAVNICTTSACPPMAIDLREPYGVMTPPPMFPRDPYSREFAHPPVRRNEVAE